MRIRIAKLEDTRGIVDVHCSDVEEWHHYENGQRREPDSYDNLTLKERYLHGGPWMSIETCAVHLNNLLLNGQIPLIAEIEGRIVGELELFISEELINGKIKKIAHIDVLEVHREFRGQGIGRELVKAAEELARKEKCELLTVTPEKEAVGFYEKVGIKDILHRGCFISIDLSTLPNKDAKAEFSIREFSWEEVKNKEIILGKFQSSYHHWFTPFKDRIAGIDDLLYFESGQIGESYYILEESFFGKDIATLYAWGDNIEELVLQIGSRAKELGFREIRTSISEKDLEKIQAFKPKVLDRFVILAKTL
ncbi:GNAT family N-acetyltransferase [Thermococcus sp. SY098]|uniref:GNAT family N-acetyltransferase n=1 Tax=Thermococcus sp. SY098 TaxID=3111325 RepID=UPI002D775EE7|nr:GNAT family N-acetyltransferase [Thermococcus sp. SY098]WRS52277.1 GNAT family N-acetyltransferase [Thermococcus sp. SY098]